MQNIAVPVLDPNRSHVREISTRPRKKDVVEFEWNSHRSSFFQWKHFHLLQHSRVPSAEATHFLSRLIIYSVCVSKACQFYEILFLIRGRFNFCECFQKRATKREWQLVVAERHLTGLHDSLLMLSSSVGMWDLIHLMESLSLLSSTWLELNLYKLTRNSLIWRRWSLLSGMFSFHHLPMYSFIRPACLMSFNQLRSWQRKTKEEQKSGWKWKLYIESVFCVRARRQRRHDEHP